jgi:hypothetical protein
VGTVRAGDCSLKGAVARVSHAVTLSQSMVLDVASHHTHAFRLYVRYPPLSSRKHTRILQEGVESLRVKYLALVYQEKLVRGEEG